MVAVVAKKKITAAAADVADYVPDDGGNLLNGQSPSVGRKTFKHKHVKNVAAAKGYDGGGGGGGRTAISSPDRRLCCLQQLNRQPRTLSLFLFRAEFYFVVLARQLFGSISASPRTRGRQAVKAVKAIKGRQVIPSPSSSSQRRLRCVFD